MNKKAILEGVLFIVGDEGVTVDEIKDILDVDNEEIKQIFMELKRIMRNLIGDLEYHI